MNADQIELQDVTPEQLRAELIALRAAHEQQAQQIAALTAQVEAYHTLAHHFPNGIVALFDSDLRYTVYDGQGLAATGMQPGDMIGKRLRDVFPPEVYERDEPLLRATLAGEETTSEVAFGEHYFEVRTAPVFDADGTITGGLVMTQDITTRKRAEIALREREQFIQRVAATVPGLLYVYDVIDDHNVYVNHEITEMLGYTADDVQRMGTAFLKFTIHPDDWPRVVATNACLNQMQDGAVEHLEYRMRRADGEWRTLHSLETPFAREPDGTLRSRLGLAFDVTEQRRTTAELERYRAHLEDLVEQRTAALRTANEHLRVLSRAKDDFVTNVSHELRTPITNLVLRQHVLAKRPTDVLQHLPVIQRETARLKHLVENLLVLSRLDQDRHNWDPAPLDLNRLVEQVIIDRQMLAREQDIRLSAQPQPALPLALADADLLEQVLGVLLTNALSYTPPGGSVQVRTFSQPATDTDAAFVGFSVIDDGPGLAPDDLPHLFERFFRGAAGRESGIPGTGLGLAIAHEIVTRHDGRLTAHPVPAPGTGAEFRVLLPLSGESPHD